jgi:predicted metal-dependent HD superfamily phosphohydrolase
MNEKQLLKQIQQYVTACFSNNQATGLIYHNLEHTEYVVKALIKIAGNYKISKRDLFMAQAAAWFLDIGVTTDPGDIETASAQLATAFLEQEQAGEEVVATVSRLLAATKNPQNPNDLLEEIFCDAGQYHLGKRGFFQRCENLRKEQTFLLNKVVSKKEWLTDTILFLETHQYHTDFCRSELDAVKEKNIAALKEKLVNIELERIVTREQAAEKVSHEAGKDKDRPEKGIETMFRITSSNNQRLSDMADNKAHILITVNSIILSAIISLVLRKLDANNYLAYPTFLLLAISLISMTFAILATRPSIPSGTYSQADLERKEVNLLFFGTFYKMPLADYTIGMMKVMDDRDFLYHTLIRDVYGQGVVLGKKYQFLRVAYNIFMYGLILSVLAFITVSVFHHGPAVIPAIKPGPHLKSF